LLSETEKIKKAAIRFILKARISIVYSCLIFDKEQGNDAYALYMK